MAIKRQKNTEKRLKQLERLMEVNLYLNSTPTLETLLSKIISVSKQILESYSASILLVDEDRGELYFEIVYDRRDEKTLQDENALKKVVLKMGEGIAGYVAQTGEPLIINDVQTNPRFSSKADKMTGVVTRNMIAIPLRAKDRIIGVMEVINRIEGDFSEDDLPIALALGNIATVAIENARLYFETEKSLRRLAKMEASKYQLVTLLFNALRSPVLSIKEYAEYVLENMEAVTAERVQDFAGMARREATTIHKMINDLYVINEYDDLVKKLSCEPLNMAEILKFHVEKRMKLDHGVAISLHFSQNTPLEHYVVPMDYEKIEHCIQHLLDVSVKNASPGEPLKVTLNAVAATRGKPRGVELEIDNGGLSLPDNLWQLVFKTFEDGEGTGSPSLEAIGLALFISKKIVDAHGGEISWEKKRPRGSRILVFLPSER
ncbi:MAG: GAF domain-containing protein [Candidatus Eremiobacteraeota bacterium]|nr:GAF domain-containing protein [Candidatus Eremiobacteraeota bacterium]